MSPGQYQVDSVGDVGRVRRLHEGVCPRWTEVATPGHERLTRSRYRYWYYSYYSYEASACKFVLPVLVVLLVLLT